MPTIPDVGVAGAAKVCASAWEKRPDITIAVEWDVIKHHFNQPTTS